MNREEYKQRFQEIEDEALKKKEALVKECALENSIYNIGDIIKNNEFIIKINTITIVKTSIYSPSLPECVYSGKVLNNDLTPTEVIRSMWASEASLKLVKAKI